MPRAEARYRITAEDRTSKGVRSAESRLSRLGTRLRAIGAAAAAGFAAAFSAIAAGSEKARRNLEQIASSSREVGESAEELRELSVAFGQLGADGNRAVDLVDALNDSLGDAIQDATSEKGRLFREQLQLDPSDLAGVENATDRVAAFAQSLEELEERGSRALREFVEQSLVGDDFSRVLDSEKLLAAVAKVRAQGIPQGTNEAAAAAEKAANAWRLAGEAWLKVFESGGVFSFLAKAGEFAANVAGAINRAVSPTPVAPAPQQQGIFLPRLDIEAQNRATREQLKAAQTWKTSAERLDRVLNRYQP